MEKQLQPIILHFITGLIMLFIVPLNPVMANNKHKDTDEKLRKKANTWIELSVLGFEENKGQFTYCNRQSFPNKIVLINRK